MELADSYIIYVNLKNLRAIVGGRFIQRPPRFVDLFCAPSPEIFTFMFMITH